MPCCWPSCAACMPLAAGIAAIITRKPLLIKSARNAGMAVCVLIWLGFASLAYLFFTDNFSMAYVVEHSNRTLPTFFKIRGHLGGAARLAAVLELPAFDLRFLRAVRLSRQASRTDAVRRRGAAPECSFSS